MCPTKGASVPAGEYETSKTGRFAIPKPWEDVGQTGVETTGYDTMSIEHRSFDWEKRWEHTAWRTTSTDMAHRFSVGLAEGGLPPQFIDIANPVGPLFWWDRKLTPAEVAIARQALTLAIGEFPDDGD